MLLKRKLIYRHNPFYVGTSNSLNYDLSKSPCKNHFVSTWFDLVIDKLEGLSSLKSWHDMIVTSLFCQLTNYIRTQTGMVTYSGQISPGSYSVTNQSTLIRWLTWRNKMLTFQRKANPLLVYLLTYLFVRSFIIIIIFVYSSNHKMTIITGIQLFICIHAKLHEICTESTKRWKIGTHIHMHDTR